MGNLMGTQEKALVSALYGVVPCLNQWFKYHSSYSTSHLWHQTMSLREKNVTATQCHVK